MTVRYTPKPETIEQKDGSPGPIRGNDGQRKRVGELGEKWNGATLSQRCRVDAAPVRVSNHGYTTAFRRSFVEVNRVVRCVCVPTGAIRERSIEPRRE
jgi:hypothetical protein